MSDEIKNGRPPLFTDVESLEKAINEYFDYCDNRIQQVYSKKQEAVIEIINPEPYTMAGLAYYLHMDRTTLLNYKKRTDDNGQEFFSAIKSARDRVAMDVERRLMEGQATGAIFNLKNNFGYVDKTEQENSGTIQVVTRKHSRFAKPAPSENTDDSQQND
jgi:hypothetical protein